MGRRRRNGCAPRPSRRVGWSRIRVDHCPRRKWSGSMRFGQDRNARDSSRTGIDRFHLGSLKLPSRPNGSVRPATDSTASTSTGFRTRDGSVQLSNAFLADPSRHDSHPRISSRHPENYCPEIPHPSWRRLRPRRRWTGRPTRRSRSQRSADRRSSCRWKAMSPASSPAIAPTAANQAQVGALIAARRLLPSLAAELTGCGGDDPGGAVLADVGDGHGGA